MRKRCSNPSRQMDCGTHPESKPMKHTYRCPKCQRTCTVYIKLTEPPVCANQNKHRFTPVYMEPTNRRKPQ